jgi:hypothetical protein
MNIKISLFMLVAMVSVAHNVRAQSHWIEIHTNSPESNVYADTTWLGTARERIFQLPDGTSTVRLLAANTSSWSVEPLSVDISMISVDTVSVTLDFPFYYALASIPSGADVFLEYQSDSIGRAPLLYTSQAALSSKFTLKKDGYIPYELQGDSNLWNRYIVSLQSKESSSTGISGGNTETPSPRKKWIDYVAASVVLIGGALAVHYKSEANDLYKQYTLTGDPALRADIDALDTRSAIALGSMQIGFTVVVVRIAF